MGHSQSSSKLRTETVSGQKAQLDAKIATMLKMPAKPSIVARRLFLFDMPHAFSDDPERGFGILNEVCEHFKVPFSTVRVGGSGQLGYSYFKAHDFSKTDSDLDVAIISPSLFAAYADYVYRFTKRYSNLTKFPRIRGVSTDRSFREYLSTGFFRPDLMPYSPERENWFSFFEQLSTKHSSHFKCINAGIFLSERLYETRNESTVSAYEKAKI